MESGALPAGLFVSPAPIPAHLSSEGQFANNCGKKRAPKLPCRPSSVEVGGMEDILKFLSQLIVAVAGGGVGGYFVLLGVRAQFKSQSKAACRALLAEVRGNYEALSGMTEKLAVGSAWEAGKPNPGWLSHSVWISQLPFVVQELDARTAETVIKAYRMLDALPEMRLNNQTFPVPYQSGGWISAHLMNAHEAFRQANDRLGDFVKDLK